MKKAAAFFLVLALLAVSLCGCSGSEKEEPIDITGIKVGALEGYNAYGFAGMTDTIELSVAETADEIKEWFINGDVDIAAVPLNIAGKLCNELETAVRMFAVTNLGVLYIMDASGTVKTLSDLNGKTVYASGKGLTSEFILNYILDRNDMLGNVTVEYMEDYDALIEAMLDGSVQTAMLPYPEAVMLKEAAGDAVNVNYSINLSDEWLNVTTTTMVQGCLICKADYAAENEEVIKTFINAYGDSVEFVNNEQDAAAKALAEAGVAESAEIARKAIDGSNIICMVGTQMLEAARSTIEILYGMDAQSMGGSLPKSVMYLTYEE